MRWVFILSIFLVLSSCGGSRTLTGTWKTGFGKLKITQKGDSLMGEFSGGGEFKALLKNDTIYFKITNASFTSKTLEGFALVKDKDNIKGKVKEEGAKLYDGTFYMMRIR